MAPAGGVAVAPRQLELPPMMTVEELANNLSLGPAAVIQALIKNGIFATMNQVIDYDTAAVVRSEDHTSELQSRQYLVCRLLLEKKKQFHLNAEARLALREGQRLLQLLLPRGQQVQQRRRALRLQRRVQLAIPVQPPEALPSPER